MALLDHMDFHGGAYAVTAYSHGNIDRTLLPVIKQLLDHNETPYKERKAHPRTITTDRGILHFFCASDQAAAKSLQGITLRGALTDEVLLYPRNFLMQLIARFSLDNPFWLMTANKEDPNHWIKTEWIDAGLVNVFESTTDDNPHISQEARKWHDLLTGHFRERMLSNEWSSEFNQVSRAGLSEGRDTPASTDTCFSSYALDDARGYAGVEGFKAKAGEIRITGVRPFDDLDSVIKHSRESGAQLNFANTPKSGVYPAITRCAFIETDTTSFGEVLSRTPPEALTFSPSAKALHDEFRAWCWTSIGSVDTQFKPDTASPAAIAAAQAVYHFRRGCRAFTQRST